MLHVERSQVDIEENQDIDIDSALEQEVVKLRKSGRFSPALEHKLNQLIEELKPDIQTANPQYLLSQLEISSFIDSSVPTASRKPGLSIIKKSIKLLTGWYFHYLVQQFDDFTYQLIQVLQSNEHRIRNLEQQLSRPDLPFEPLEFPAVDLAIDPVCSAIESIRSEGKIMLADAASDRLLEELSNRFDTGLVYGITLDEARAEQIASAKLDVRIRSLVNHLESLVPSSHRSIVLRGAELELSSSSLKLMALKLAATALEDEGTLLLLVHQPPAARYGPKIAARAAIFGEPWPTGAWIEATYHFGFFTREVGLKSDLSLLICQKKHD
jgi:hypothetical protein